MRKESFAYLRVQCQSVLCQLELAQGSKANSSNLVKVLEYHKKLCLMFHPKHKKKTESANY